MKSLLVFMCLLLSLVTVAQKEADEVTVVQTTGLKFQFVNKFTGLPVSAQLWDETDPFVNGFSRVFLKDKFGFVNDKGRLVTDVEYEDARNFLNSLAAVKKDGFWGMINEKGKIIFPFTFDIIFDFEADISVSLENKQWWLIKSNGQKMMPLDITVCYGFKNGVAKITKNNQEGLLYPDGKILLGVRKNSVVKPIAYHPNTSNVVTPCPPNIDFEYGNFTNWQCYIGTVDSVGNTNVITVAPSPPTANRHTIITRTIPSALDPFGLFPINPPDGSNKAVRLGNTSTGAQAERIRYTVHVPLNDSNFSIKYDYAVVFQDPGHTAWTQPRFTAKLLDSATNTYIDCASFVYISTAGLPGFQTSPVNNQVIFKPWSSVFFSMRGQGGKTLYLEFTTADCVRRAHWGYAYVDVETVCGQAIDMQYDCTYPNITTLTGPPGFQTYNWWNQNFTSLIGTGQTVTLNPGPAFNTIMWLEMIPYTNFGCKDTLQVRITGTKIPSFDASDTTVCGAPHTFTFYNKALPSIVANWNFGDGNTAVGDTVTHTYTAPGTYTVSLNVTVPSGCNGSSTRQIVINPLPNVVQPANQVRCNGTATAAINFSGSLAGTGFSWTNNNTTIGLVAGGNGNIGSFTAINNGAAPVTATITVTPSANACPGPPQVFTITVNPTPNVTQPTNQSLCNGAASSLVGFSGAVSGTTFSWTNNNTTIGLAASGNGNIPSFTAVNNGTVPVTATITVSPTANGCPGPAQSFTIIVNPTPDMATPTNQSLCNGANTTLVSFTGATVSGTSFSWTNDNTTIGLAANGIGNIASFTVVNTGSTSITATITVIPSANGCPGAPKIFTITVKPTPDVVQPANQILCNGATTTLISFSGAVTGSTFSWTNNTNSIGLAASGTGNIASFTAVNAGTTPVTATITVIPSAVGCPGLPQTFTITVNPTPDVLQPSNQTLCNGASTTLVSFSGAVSGTNFGWSNNNTSIGLAASGTGNIASFTAVNPGSIPVTATITVTPSAASCPGTARVFTITVNPSPNVVQPANQSLCNGATTNLVSFSGAVTGTAFSWINDNTSIGLAASGNGNIASFTAINLTNTPVTATITVSPSAAGCPGISQTFTITVNPTPDVEQSANQTLCNGAATALISFSGAVSGTGFSWTNNNTAIGLAASGNGNIAAFTAINLTNAPITATITVMPSAAGCPGSPQVFTITVNPTPNVVQPANQTLCNGASTNLVSFGGAVSGTGFSWTNDNTTIGLAASGTGNIASFTAVNTGTTPVTASITVTPAAAGCPGVPQIFTITVNPTPTVAQPANQTLCNGATTNLISFSGAISGTGFSWVNDNTSIGLAASGTGNIASFTVVNTGTTPATATITVTPTAAGCPGLPQIFTITVNPTPDVAQPANQILCNGAATALIGFSGAVSGTGFSWTNNNTAIGLVASGNGNIPSFTAINITTAPITATITVTPSASGCPGAPQVFTITVNPTPNVVQPANQILCNGAATALISFSGAVSGTGFSWTNNNTSIGLVASGNGNIPSFTAINLTNAPVTATITVTPSAAGCPGAPQTFTITVNPTPNVIQPANQFLCNGATTNLVSFSGAVSGTGFSWTNDNTSIGLAASGIGNIASFTAVNTGTTPVTARITVTPSAVGCPGLSQTFTITVNPTPNVAQPANQILCNGATTNLISFSGVVNGTGFSWTNNNTAIGLAASGNGNILSFTAINLTNAPVTATITVTPSAAGCPGAPQTFTITVNPTPNVAQPANQFLCNGATTNLVSFSGAVSGTGFSWTNDNTSIGLAASGVGNIASFAAVNTGTTPVTARITVTPSAVGCPGLPQTFTITVNPTPNVAQPANQILCNGATTNLISFSGAVSGTGFNWTNDNTSIGLAASGNGNIAAFTAINLTNTPVTATITVTPSAAGCPGSPQVFTITINPTPNVEQPANQILCNGASTTLISFSGAVSGTGFSWTNNNTSIGLAASGNGNIAAFTAINLTNTAIIATITVTPAAAGCPGAAQTFTIIVNPTPNVAQPANQILCNGATTNAIAFTGAVSGSSFSWTNSNTSIGLAGSGNGDIPAFTAVNLTNAPITATITVSASAAGCSGTAQTFTITVKPTPNVAQPANQALCNGATTNAIAFIGAVSGSTFAWTNSNPSIGLAASGNGDIPAFTAINLTNVPVTATITVSPFAAGCPGTAQTFTITVNPTPNVAQPANQVLCNGATTNAIAFSGAVSGSSFSWTNSNPTIGLAASGNGDIPAFTAINLTNAPVTATITVTPFAVGCPGAAQTFAITVNPTPDVVQPTNQTLCNSTTTTAVNFSGAVSGTSFNWTNSNPSIGLAASGNGNIPAFMAVNLTNTAITATISIVPSAGGCTGLPKIFTITVNPGPNVAQPLNQTLCNGSVTNPINFTGAVAGTVFSWTNSDPSIGLAASGNGDIPTFTTVNTTTSPVTATITVSPFAIGCPGPPKSFTITVNPTPNVVQPSDQILCSGATSNAIVFTGAVSGSTFGWTNNNTSIGLAAAGNGDIPAFTAINLTNVPVTATITVTPSATGCPGLSQIFTITVNPTPNVAQPAYQALCNGATTNAIAFTGAVSGSTFAWTNSNTSIGLAASGNGDIPAFTAINLTNVPVTATITVTPSAAGCPGAAQIFTITVNPTPDVAQPANQVLCNGATTNAIAFTGAVSGSNFSWTNSNTSIGLAGSGNGGIPAFTAVNLTNVPVTATITVTPSAAGCPGAAQTFTITVNPTPNVAQPANQVLCNGATTNAITFTGAVSGSSFSWTNSNTSIGLAATGNGDIPAFTAVNLTNAPVTATITVMPSAAGCPGAAQIFAITVNPTPVLTQPTNQMLCNGTTTNAVNFAGSVNGSTYNWTNDNTSVGLAASGSGNIPAFTVINLTNAAITATITVTPAAAGCPGLPQTFTITVKPTPVLAPIASQTLCNGAATNPINFTGTVAATSFSWTNSNPLIGLAASGNGNIPTFTAVNPTNNQLTAIITATASAVGCQGASQTFTIAVNPTPDVAKPTDQILCNGASTNAIAFSGAVSATAYSWTNNNTSIGLVVAGNGAIASFTAINTTNIPAIAVIEVAPLAAGCPGTPKTFTITVNPTPDVVKPADQILCHGEITKQILFAGTVAGTSFSWTNSNTAIGLQASGSGNITSFTALNPGSVAISALINVTPFAKGCAGPPQVFTIRVTPAPAVSLGADLNLSTGTLVTLNAAIQNGPITNWLWIPSTGLSCSNCPAPVLKVSNNASYTVIVTNQYGCKASDDIIISTFCENAQVFIPNAFTPDGDGLNDILMVRGKGISVKSFRIFNRWGELVFEKTNFSPNDIKYGWDGKVRGVPASPDVFVYTTEVICDNGTVYTYKGNSTLLK